MAHIGSYWLESEQRIRESPRVHGMVDYVHGKKLEFRDHNDREVAGVHDEKVIEAFQKFDADGSGNISREELAEAGAAGAKLTCDTWSQVSQIDANS